MKYQFLSLFLVFSGVATAQPYPFLGYTVYDHLVTATHPNGCPPEYVTGLPDDSTWVNMLDNTVMTGYFGNTWKDLPGDDLLLEACFHHHNYGVRLILQGGSFSGVHSVDVDDWSDHPWVDWKHIFPGCVEGQAASGRLLLPLDFGLFGISPETEVVGIEITFLPTVGQADFAGAYIIVPPCELFTLGPDTTICPGATINLDATTPDASYLWQDGSTEPVFQNAGPGSYWVEITIYDCSKTDYLNIMEHASPPDLGDDLILCEGETYILDVTMPGAYYRWHDSSTQPTYTVTEDGVYAVTITVDGCTFTDNIEVSYIDPPVIDLGNDTTICEGIELLLNASVPGATYTWQDQSTDSTYLVIEPGEYAVTVAISGCTGEDVIEVGYIYPEPIDLGPDETLCDGETLYVDAFTPGATYLWQDNSTFSGYTIVEPGIYWVLVETDNCSISDTIEVEYLPGIFVDLGNDTTLCLGQSLILDVTQPGATYTWQDQSTGSTFHVNAPGEYYVGVENGGCIANDTIQVSYVNAVNIQLGPDTNLCFGETILLDANLMGASFEWQDQSTGSTFLVIQQGQYWVNATLNGCTDSDTIQIDYAMLSPINLGEDTTLCNGEILSLDATQPGASYLWQDNSNSSMYTIAGEGIYNVTVTLGSCSISDTIKVDYQSLGPIMLGNDTTLCEGETVWLEVFSPGATLEWQDHSTNSTFLVNAPGTYWVTAHQGDCSVSDTIQVNYISLASLDLGSDTTLCDGQHLLLDAGLPGASYLWQDNSTNQTFEAQQTGMYWVQVSLLGCDVEDTIQIDFQSLNAIALGNDTLLCEGETHILDPTNNNASYVWQDQTTDSIFIVSQPGVYWVIASVGNCQISDTIAVSYQSLPFVELGNDTTLCAGEQLILNASYPGATYEWQDQSTQEDFLVTGPGTYSVNVRSGYCEFADTINISYLELSSIHLGPDTTLCDGEALTLELNAPGAQYEWQDQSIGQSYLVTQPGLYWVKVSLADCTSTDTILVNFSPYFALDIGVDTILCPGESLLLDAETAGATYLWQDQSHNSTYLVTQSGNYHVTLNVDGCVTADTIMVTYFSFPEEILPPDTTLCDGATILLDAVTPGAQYQWQDLSTDATLLVSQPGIYTITLTLGHCSTSDIIVIQYAHPIIVDLGIDRTLCDGESLLLSLDFDGEAEFAWQDHSTTSSYEVTQAGLYWVEVKDACSVDVDSILVTTENCECQIYISNVFSPNGDAVNDVFFPQASCAFTSYHLTIFDRFGGLIFETSVPGQSWDGLVKSKPAQVGVYVYVLTYAFEDGVMKRVHGDVTLMR